MKVEARLYEELENKVVKCKTCPHYCILKPGQTGICGLRRNEGGKLYFLVYGELVTEAVDPIFKKPLFNFYPGHDIYSVSSIGCNFKCPWCQNWTISQVKPGEAATYYVSPEELVKRVKRLGLKLLAFTYAEPAVWFEYVYDVFKLCHENGILNVLVTNGYWSIESLSELSGLIDAANVDVKGFTETFYRKYPKASLKPVLDSVMEMFKQGVHVELTMLIVPTANDNLSEVEEFSKWVVRELSPDTPIHFSRFFPNYMFTNVDPTPIDFLIKCREVAVKTGLRYVYLGNVPSGFEDTFCPNCKAKVIGRVGFELIDWNLDEENRCRHCGFKVAVRGSKGERKSKFWPYL